MKKLSSLLFVGALAFALTGCGDCGFGCCGSMSCGTEESKVTYSDCDCFKPPKCCKKCRPKCKKCCNPLFHCDCNGKSNCSSGSCK